MRREAASGGISGVTARARVRAPGGCASDAVEERTGVAIDEDNAGEDGVAAAATPRPKSARCTRGCGGEGSSFSLSDFAGEVAALGKGGLPRLTNTRLSSSCVGILGVPGATMDVIGLIGFGAGVPPPAEALGGCTLGLGLGVCVCVGLASPALEASAHIDATAITRPPRPPRADLTSYFISI